MNRSISRSRLAAALALTVAFSAFSSVDIDNIRIARYRHDHGAAISFTYDDGYPDHVSLAAPMLDKYGFKGTFFLIVGSVLENDAAVGAAGEPATSWDDWRAIAAQGHEIGNHTWSHANLTQKDAATIEYEVNHAYDIIAEQIGSGPVSFCYPFNLSSGPSQAIVNQRHLVSRSFQKTYGGSSFTTAQANDYVDEALEDGAWMVAMIHAIEDGWKPFSSADVLDEHFAYVNSLDDIWVATFGEAGLYRREFDAASVTGAAVNGDVVTFTVESSLAADRVSTPLTVALPAQNVTTASAVQAGVSIPVSVAADKIMIDCTPGGGPVTLTLGVESSLAHKSIRKEHELKVSHDVSRARLMLRQSAAANSDRAYDIRGRILSLRNRGGAASSVVLPGNCAGF